MKNLTQRLLFIAIIILALILSACAQSQDTSEVITAADLPSTSWDSILQQADGQTVNLYMWGGSDQINRYISDWAAKRLLEEANVTLRLIPMNDTRDILNQLLAQKQATVENNGTIDIMWINGENFKIAKENELLWGSFAGKLPNAQAYIDLESPDIAYDFGLSTEGMEAPWGKAQFVFVYDSERFTDPPTSIVALKEWVQQNPGQFTYPAPPEFNGSAFVRHVMFELTGGHEQYLEAMEPEEFLSKLEPVWAYLNEIKPYLWREGATYPESLSRLDSLYADGEVWMTLGFNSARAASMVENGIFQASTRTFVLDQGTITNHHYLAIPYNAPNPAGALVAINFLLSPEAQIQKYDPLHWGEDMALDANKLSGADQAKLAAIELGPAVLPPEVLSAHQLPEIHSSLVDLLEKSWIEHVAKQ